MYIYIYKYVNTKNRDNIRKLPRSTCIHIYMYIYIYVHVCVRIYIYICMYVYMDVYILGPRHHSVATSTFVPIEKLICI